MILIGFLVSMLFFSRIFIWFSIVWGLAQEIKQAIGSRSLHIRVPVEGSREAERPSEFMARVLEAMGLDLHRRCCLAVSAVALTISQPIVAESTPCVLQPQAWRVAAGKAAEEILRQLRKACIGRNPTGFRLS